MMLSFFGLLLASCAAKVQMQKDCPSGDACPSSLSVTLPPPDYPCPCTTSSCSVFTAAIDTLDPSFVTLTTTTQIPKSITTYSSCPIFSETTTVETVVQSFTQTTVLTLSDSTTTVLSTVTNLVSMTTTRTTKCHSKTTDTDCSDCNCGSNFTTTLNPPTNTCQHHRHHCHQGGHFRRCYYGCPEVSHEDRLMYVLPNYTSCYQSVVCPTYVPLPTTGVPPVIPVCPSCPPLPTVTITPDNYVITVIAYGPSPTSLNIACLTA